MKTYRFRKSERLCSKKAIEALFEGGHPSVSVYPVRAVFMSVPQVPVEPTAIQDPVLVQEPTPAQAGERCTPRSSILISVSKRHFKHAVDRNHVKRQLREAWRLNRHLLTDHLPAGISLHIAFIWLSDELFPSSVVHAKMQKLLLRIRETLCLGQQTPLP